MWSDPGNLSKHPGDRARFFDAEFDELFRKPLTTGEWETAEYLSLAESLKARGAGELIRLQERLIDELAALRFHVPEPPEVDQDALLEEMFASVLELEKQIEAGTIIPGEVQDEDEELLHRDGVYDWLWPYLHDVKKLAASRCACLISRAAGAARAASPARAAAAAGRRGCGRSDARQGPASQPPLSTAGALRRSRRGCGR